MDPQLQAFFENLLQEKLGEAEQCYHQEMLTHDEAWQKWEQEGQACEVALQAQLQVLSVQMAVAEERLQSRCVLSPLLMVVLINIIFSASWFFRNINTVDEDMPMNITEAPVPARKAIQPGTRASQKQSVKTPDSAPSCNLHSSKSPGAARKLAVISPATPLPQLRSRGQGKPPSSVMPQKSRSVTKPASHTHCALISQMLVDMGGLQVWYLTH